MSFNKKEWSKQYHKENKVKIREQSKKYKKDNKSKISEWNKEYNQRPEVKLRVKEYYSNPKVKAHKKEIDRAYHKNNIKKIKEKKGEYYQKNRKDVLEKCGKYQQENKEKRNLNCRKRMINDWNFIISKRLRNRLRKCFLGYTKTGKIKSSKLYGVDFKAIIEHLKPFPEDRENYHIDHIRPLCSFEFCNEDGTTNLEEVGKAFAPKNHQWLTAKENMSKNGKYNGEVGNE